jgi:hypothetical protein
MPCSMSLCPELFSVSLSTHQPWTPETSLPTATVIETVLDRMWLLDVRSKELKQVAHESSQPYGILSHVWLQPNEEEVSFWDLSNTVRRLGARRKKGYAKLHSVCKMAEKHGLKYVWVDTCCINAANESERAEAIRSMYKWRKTASVCYACLFDAIRPPESEWYLEPSQPQIPDSAWFRR